MTKYEKVKTSKATYEKVKQGKDDFRWRGEFTASKDSNHQPLRYIYWGDTEKECRDKTESKRKELDELGISILPTV